MKKAYLTCLLRLGEGKGRGATPQPRRTESCDVGPFGVKSEEKSATSRPNVNSPNSLPGFWSILVFVWLATVVAFSLCLR